MKGILFFLLLCSANLFAQDSNKLHYLDFVESYYDRETKKPLYIYDNINGKIVDTLVSTESKNSWYKIAILESDYGWFKIKNIQRIPDVYKNYGYENYWVKASNFLITINSYNENRRVYLYDEPTKASNKIHKTDSFQLVNIIETSELWAKVSFVVGKKTVTGWLNYQDQCAYPWTTCPKYE